MLKICLILCTLTYTLISEQIVLKSLKRLLRTDGIRISLCTKGESHVRDNPMGRRNKMEAARLVRAEGTTMREYWVQLLFLSYLKLTSRFSCQHPTLHYFELNSEFRSWISALLSLHVLLGKNFSDEQTLLTLHFKVTFFVNSYLDKGKTSLMTSHLNKNSCSLKMDLHIFLISKSLYHVLSVWTNLYGVDE